VREFVSHLAGFFLLSHDVTRYLRRSTMYNLIFNISGPLDIVVHPYSFAGLILGMLFMWYGILKVGTKNKNKNSLLPLIQNYIK
jgi:hypothetical protein